MHNNETPVVTVIIPVYNAEEHLKECMESVKTQTLQEIEIICINDGSTDGSKEILDELSKADSRVKVIHQENAGAGAARNNGLKRAQGKYLSFLDADDFFEPNMLEKAVETAERYDADYVVYKSDQYITQEDSYKHPKWVVREGQIPPYNPFMYRQMTGNIFKVFVGWAWDKLFRRSFVEENNLCFQEQRTSNDLLFVFSALVYAKRIAVCRDVLAHQRRDTGGSLSKTREKSWHCFYDALTALRENIVAAGKWKELEKDYINYALHFTLWNYNSLAEPTKSMLEEKLLDNWFADLGITNKNRDYFTNQEEYNQYLELIDAR